MFHQFDFCLNFVLHKKKKTREKEREKFRRKNWRVAAANLMGAVFQKATLSPETRAILRKMFDPENPNKKRKSKFI